MKILVTKEFLVIEIRVIEVRLLYCDQSSYL